MRIVPARRPVRAAWARTAARRTRAEATAFAFVLEWSFRLPGMGPRTLEALRGTDLNWLMAACLSLGVVTALTHIVADGVLGSPRTRRGGA